MRIHLILPNDSQPRAVAKVQTCNPRRNNQKVLGDLALTGVYTFVA
jgi:hypothetical protein